MTLSVDEARAKFAAAGRCQQSIDLIELNYALGRVAATRTRSGLDVPPLDNSAMDGFAVNSQDLKKLPARYSVSQRITAGQIGLPLAAGTAARIFTGAPLPLNADAVVIQEQCEYKKGVDGNSVVILKRVEAGNNVRPAGQDIGKGDTVVRQGQRLNAIDLGLLASTGTAQVTVYKPLRVAVFSTGNELAIPAAVLKPGQIYNSNRTMLLSLCRQLGFEVIDCGIVADTLSATKRGLSEAAQQADVVISSGGVSVGEEDHIKPAIQALGNLEQWKVQMKPGKPVVLGRMADTPLIGLPGNPVSAFVVFQLLAVPLLKSMQGEVVSSLRSIPISSAFSKSSVSREEFIRVRLCTKKGQAAVELFDNQSSGVLSSLAWADGLVRQRVNDQIVVGQDVEFLPLFQGMLQ